MRQLIGITLALCLGAMGTAWAKGPVTGPGNISIGVDASEWSSDTVTDFVTVIAVGGSGQLNGGFTVAERYGIQIGLRAQDRFIGPLSAGSNQNGKIGIYEAVANAAAGAAS